jgi:hypothetical protein
VLVVLIKISQSEKAIAPRLLSGMRAFLPAAARAVPVKAVPVKAAPVKAAPAYVGPVTSDPRAAAAPQAAHALTGPAGLRLAGQPTSQTISISDMTRTSAAGEGALGPHPAREPEPV